MIAKTVWIGLFALALVWSGVGPFDRYTWVLEVLPAVVGAAVLVFTWRRYPLTPLVFWLILVHCLILMVGGHYTYARVPLFDWIAAASGSARNDFDKLGHFAQGFVPALIARELLLRLAVVNGRRWLAFLVACFCLALSATYELIEWWVAMLSKQAADAFLGTQGYVWDTQSDMAWALFGAVVALVALGRVHDRQLQRHPWPASRPTPSQSPVRE